MEFTLVMKVLEIRPSYEILEIAVVMKILEIHPSYGNSRNSPPL